MSETFAGGAVLYARDMQKVSTFYAAVLGVSPAERDDEHVRLASAGFEVVIRQIPERIAAGIEIATPPARRADAAVKLVLAVSDMSAVRTAVAAHGGVMDPAPKPWLYDGRQVWDALDPEGNVIQFRSPN